MSKELFESGIQWTMDTCDAVRKRTITFTVSSNLVVYKSDCPVVKSYCTGKRITTQTLPKFDLRECLPVTGVMVFGSWWFCVLRPPR